MARGGRCVVRRKAAERAAQVAADAQKRAANEARRAALRALAHARVAVAFHHQVPGGGVFGEVMYGVTRYNDASDTLDLEMAGEAPVYLPIRDRKWKHETCLCGVPAALRDALGGCAFKHADAPESVRPVYRFGA